MTKAMIAVLATLTLSGCVIQPPARTVVQTAAAPVAEYRCAAEFTKGNQPAQYLADVVIRDYGYTFTVSSTTGKLIDESPTLTAGKAHSMTGFKSGSMYSKGTGKYAGFFGRFVQTADSAMAISYDCR